MAAKNALILHGTNGSPESNWLTWLGEQLAVRGYEVEIPQLPGADHPMMDPYWQALKDFTYNDRTLIVGHSSGAVAAFGILNRLPVEQKVGRVISVAGFYRDEGFGCEDLMKEPWDWEKIRTQAYEIDLIYSSDDPLITPDQTEYLAEQLRVDPILFEGSQHFGTTYGGERFRQFPELLELILSPR